MLAVYPNWQHNEGDSGCGLPSRECLELDVEGNIHLTSVLWCKESPACAGTNLAAKYSTTIRISAKGTSTQVVGSVWVRLQMDLHLKA